MQVAVFKKKNDRLRKQDGLFTSALGLRRSFAA